MESCPGGKLTTYRVIYEEGRVREYRTEFSIGPLQFGIVRSVPLLVPGWYCTVPRSRRIVSFIYVLPYSVWLWGNIPSSIISKALRTDFTPRKRSWLLSRIGDEAAECQDGSHPVSVKILRMSPVLKRCRRMLSPSNWLPLTRS